MKKIFLTTLLPAFIFTACGQKFYSKKDYTFYDQNFQLTTNSLLKTNGIYVLNSIWTNENGGSQLPIKQNKIYKFYKTGQSNFWLAENLKSDADYLLFLENGDLNNNSKKRTLFQGYYKTKENKIIIENVNTSLKRFNYTYGFIEDNKLIIVKEDVIEGKGKFDQTYFTTTYKETYLFKEIKSKQDTVPNW